jgi:hypothetical protein
VEFRLEDMGGYWRVEELSNLNELVDMYLHSQPERSSREVQSFLFDMLTL